MTLMQVSGGRGAMDGELPATLAAKLTPTLRDALRHPLRRQILRALNDADAPQGPAEIAVTVGAGLSLVGYHAQVLAGCGSIVLPEPKNGGGSLYASAVGADSRVLMILRATRRRDRRICL